MDGKKVEAFMTLAGQARAQSFDTMGEKERVLGAQLLLSEVLEYVIKGLGVIPSIDGHAIRSPDALSYRAEQAPDKEQMLDGLCDVAYTMYWNALCFGVPLEEGFDLVCDNNLEKFVGMDRSTEGEVPRDHWHCGKGITWPESVVRVEVIRVESQLFAVGKDGAGKVRKPSSYKPVDLTTLSGIGQK